MQSPFDNVFPLCKLVWLCHIENNQSSHLQLHFFIAMQSDLSENVRGQIVSIILRKEGVSQHQIMGRLKV